MIPEKKDIGLEHCDRHLVFFYESKFMNVNQLHFEIPYRARYVHFEHKTVFSQFVFSFRVFKCANKIREKFILFEKTFSFHTGNSPTLKINSVISLHYSDLFCNIDLYQSFGAQIKMK